MLAGVSSMNSGATAVARKVKYAVYTVNVLFNIALAVFPGVLPQQVQDQLLISFTACTVITVVFVLEEIRLLLQEQ